MQNDNGWLFWAADHPSDNGNECLQITEWNSDALFINEGCSDMAGFFCEITP